MGKKKKEHAAFDQMISKKNNSPFAKMNNKYSAQAAPKNDTAAQNGSKVNFTAKGNFGLIEKAGRSQG